MGTKMSSVIRLLWIFVFGLHCVNSYVVPICAGDFVGEKITACNDEGMRCTCYADGTTACVDLCPPIKPPNDECYKAKVPETYRNATTGYGCCSSWVCDGDDQVCGVVEMCGAMEAEACMCHNGMRTRCTPLCTWRVDYNDEVCSLTDPPNVGGIHDTPAECCPTQVCPWDPQSVDGQSNDN